MVRVAALVVALPTLLVKTASYSLPFIEAVTLESVNVVEVAPLIFVKVMPPSVLTSHCTVGAGLPLAAAVKVAFWPAFTVWLLGLVVTDGAKSTVSVAALVVALPRLLVKTASYSLPFIAAVTLESVSVVLVAPLMLEKVLPPSVLTSHCTVGDGLPLAAAVNVAFWPALTVTSLGFVVTVGGDVLMMMSLLTPSDPVEPGVGSVRLALPSALLMVPPFSVSAVVLASSRGLAFCPAATVYVKVSVVVPLPLL